VRGVMVPDWDIHPERVSHTWAIDTRTGRPYEARTERVMENWGFSGGKSADELADYLSYALRILRNAGLPCEGVTTPGGFGNRVLPELAQATQRHLDIAHTQFDGIIQIAVLAFFPNLDRLASTARARHAKAGGILAIGAVR